jgi:hypothetical protein
MIKYILVICTLLFSSFLYAQDQTTPTVTKKHVTKHCDKAKAKGMANDKKRYEKWCKQHPGKCSKTVKMFD